MKHLITAAIVAMVVALGAIAVASAHSDDDGDEAEAKLDGFQENPSISTTGSGELKLRINEDLETIDYELSYSGLEADAIVSHIHFSRERVNGPVSVFLCGGPLTNNKPRCPAREGTVSGTILASEIPAGAAAANGLDTFAEFVAALDADALYVNVHSTKWPGGEIRGQIDD